METKIVWSHELDTREALKNKDKAIITDCDDDTRRRKEQSWRQGQFKIKYTEFGHNHASADICKEAFQSRRYDLGDKQSTIIPSPTWAFCGAMPKRDCLSVCSAPRSVQHGNRDRMESRTGDKRSAEKQG